MKRPPSSLELLDLQPIRDADHLPLLVGDELYSADTGLLTLTLGFATRRKPTLSLETKEGLVFKDGVSSNDLQVLGLKHVQTGEHRATYRRHGAPDQEGRSSDTVLYRTVAQADPPFGPGLSAEEMLEVEKIEQYVSSNTPEGKEWVEFALYDSEGNLKERRRFLRRI